MNKFEKLLSIAKKPPLLRVLAFQKVAAGVEHYHVLKPLPCKFIVDVGANRGQFSLVARSVFPDATIHAFEPLEKPTRVYRNVFAKDARVTLHQCAIGYQETTATMHVAGADDSSSLLPLGDEQITLFPDTKEKTTVKISVAPLDKFINANDIISPALLKIDVQGYELEVLRGCQSTLEAFQYIYVECSFVELYEGQALVDDVLVFLHAKSFALKGVYNVYYDRLGRAIQGDFLFVRKT